VRPADVTRLPWRRPIWRIRGFSDTAVLHCYDASRCLEDVHWEHHFLTTLETRFPAPRPMGLLDGASAAVIENRLYATVSYIPGRLMGWDTQPPLESAGRFMAAYHEAAAGTDAAGPGPSIPRLEELPGAVPWSRLASCLGGPEGVRRYRHHLDQAFAGLGSSLQPDQDAVVIHGDLTTLNVIVDGDPPHCSGLIDFAMAHRANPLADLGYGLWQAGRARFHDIGLDPARVARWVAGYHARRRLDEQAAAQLPFFLQARGCQLIARWAARHERDLTLTLHRLDSIAALRERLRDSVQSALQ
jgi:Ser/Thr protein kinase RdoA (MazF antagonist)